MEEQIYWLDVEQHERFAAAANGAAILDWEEQKTRWLRDADRARSLKTPESQWPVKPVPAWRKMVIVTAYTPGPYEIRTAVGPERVADGVLILPPVESYGVENYAPGVTAIGNRTSDGGYWVALPGDTRPTGFTVVHLGRKLEKLEDMGNLGGRRRSFYFDRGPAA